MPSDRPIDEEGVLAPTDLDIEDSEHVSRIDGDRYVVATDEDGLDERALPSADAARYDVSITATLEGRTVRHRIRSDDVLATFDELLDWYARQLDDDLPPERSLEILLTESELGPDARHEIERAIDRHGLDRSDPIAALLSILDRPA